jgi:hypothetical protein
MYRRRTPIYLKKLILPEIFIFGKYLKGTVLKMLMKRPARTPFPRSRGSVYSVLTANFTDALRCEGRRQGSCYEFGIGRHFLQTEFAGSHASVHSPWLPLSGSSRNKNGVSLRSRSSLRINQWFRIRSNN